MRSVLRVSVWAIAIAAVVASFWLATAALGRSKLVAQVRVVNPYNVGLAIDVDCGSGKWRRRYLGPKKAIVLMLDSTRCTVKPVLWRHR